MNVWQKRGTDKGAKPVFDNLNVINSKELDVQLELVRMVEMLLCYCVEVRACWIWSSPRLRTGASIILTLRKRVSTKTKSVQFADNTTGVSQSYSLDELQQISTAHQQSQEMSKSINFNKETWSQQFSDC